MAKFNDPFSVGQLVGILIVLTFIEKNNGMPIDFAERLKTRCAEASGEFLSKPAEDIFLMVEGLVKEIEKTG